MVATTNRNMRDGKEVRRVVKAHRQSRATSKQASGCRDRCWNGPFHRCHPQDRHSSTQYGHYVWASGLVVERDEFIYDLTSSCYVFASSAIRAMPLGDGSGTPGRDLDHIEATLVS